MCQQKTYIIGFFREHARTASFAKILNATAKKYLQDAGLAVVEHPAKSPLVPPPSTPSLAPHDVGGRDNAMNVDDEDDDDLDEDEAPVKKRKKSKSQTLVDSPDKPAMKRAKSSEDAPAMPAKPPHARKVSSSSKPKKLPVEVIPISRLVLSEAGRSGSKGAHASEPISPPTPLDDGFLAPEGPVDRADSDSDDDSDAEDEADKDDPPELVTSDDEEEDDDGVLDDLTSDDDEPEQQPSEDQPLPKKTKKRGRGERVFGT